MTSNCVNDFIFFIETVLRRAKAGSLSGNLQEGYLEFKDEEGAFQVNFPDNGTDYEPAVPGKSFRQALEERIGEPVVRLDRTVLTSSILPFLRHVFNEDVDPYVSIDIEDLSVDVPDVTMGVSRQVEGDLTVYYKFNKEGVFILGTGCVECHERLDPHLPSPESAIDWVMALSRFADSADCEGWRSRQNDRHLILSRNGKKDMDVSYENGRLRVDVADGPSILLDDTPSDIWKLLKIVDYFGKIPDAIIARHWKVLGDLVWLAKELGGYVEAIPGRRVRVRVDYPDKFVRVNVGVSNTCYVEIEHFGKERWIKFLAINSMDEVRAAVKVMKDSSFDLAAIDTFMRSLTSRYSFFGGCLSECPPPGIKFKDNAGFADAPLTPSASDSLGERPLEEPEIRLRLKGMGVDGEMLNSLAKSWVSLQKDGYSVEDITKAVRQEMANQAASNKAEPATGSPSAIGDDEKRHLLERAMADTVMEMSGLYTQEETRDVFDAAMEDAYPDPEEEELPVVDDDDDDDDISGGPDLYEETGEPEEIPVRPTDEFEEIINTYGSDFEGQPIGKVRFSHAGWILDNSYWSTAEWVDTPCPLKLKVECCYTVNDEGELSARKWKATVSFNSRVFEAESETLDGIIKDYNETFNALMS